MTPEPTPVVVGARRQRESRPARRGKYDLTHGDLAGILAGLPKYRVAQIWDGLIIQGLDPGEITTVPKDLRSSLAANPELGHSLTLVSEQTSDNGQTVKWLWSLDQPGPRTPLQIEPPAPLQIEPQSTPLQIETVLMHYRDRSTVCISSQAGCAMGCGFCATGQGGFFRQLQPGEIIEQVAMARKRCQTDGRRLSNVVFMGMGEPMANFDAVWTSVERFNTDFEMSARHLTISTVGIVPGITKLAQKGLQVNLAVSLHAANDDKRNALVPINRTYPLEMLWTSCRDYFEATNRRVSFEWALIDGVNDTPNDVDELADFALSLSAHVNLIPLNTTPGYPTRGSSKQVVAGFVRGLTDQGVNATVRQNRGTSIDAACGQLAARFRSQN